MKIIIFFVYLIGITISFNAHAWWSFPLDNLEFTDRSGSVYGPGSPHPPQSIRIIQNQDFTDYYLYIEIAGIKPEEVDIQRQGSRITIKRISERIEKNQSEDSYSSFQSYSSFSRSLMLPPNADPDVSKMERENNPNYIRLKIPKRTYHSFD